MHFIRKRQKKDEDLNYWGNNEGEEKSHSMWSREVIKKLLKKAGLC